MLILAIESIQDGCSLSRMFGSDPLTCWSSVTDTREYFIYPLDQHVLKSLTKSLIGETTVQNDQVLEVYRITLLLSEFL